MVTFDFIYNQICVSYIFLKFVFRWNYDHDMALCDTPPLDDTPLCDTPNEIILHTNHGGAVTKQCFVLLALFQAVDWYINGKIVRMTINGLLMLIYSDDYEWTDWILGSIYELQLTSLVNLQKMNKTL